MRTTVRAIRDLKGTRPIVLLSAYDAIWARLAEEAGADILLVGDSVGIEVLGYGSVIPVSLDMVLHHLQAVVRATQTAMVVADMPLGDYGVNHDATINNAVRLIKEGGAGAVKMAGGAELADAIATLSRIGIPVMGHIGVNSSHASLGLVGPVVGNTVAERTALCADAETLEQAGVFALIAKCVDPAVAQQIAVEREIPVISIGSGQTDGIGSNIVDVVGLARRSPWFSLRQVPGDQWFGGALHHFVSGVMDGTIMAKVWEDREA